MPGEEPQQIPYSGKGIGPYDDKEPWERYVDRLAEHFESVGMRNAGQQRAALTSTVGSETYGLMQNLLGQNEKPRDKTFQQLVDLVASHKNPTPPWQSERLKFLNRDRLVERGETVNEYVAELRKLAATCQFTPEEYNDRLRDRLLHGIKNAEMQLEMIKVGTAMTLASGLDAALRIEATMRSVEVLKHPTKPTEISCEVAHRVDQRKACWRCNGKHSPDTCKFKDKECFGCKRKGHIRSQCRGKKKGHYPLKEITHNKGERNEKQHRVQEDKQLNDETFGVYVISSTSTSSVHVNANDVNDVNANDVNKVQSLQVTVSVENQPVLMEVDTGASRSLVSEKVYFDSLSHCKLEQSGIVLRSYSGQVIPVKGEIRVTAKYGSQSHDNLKLIVVEGNKPSLLGRDWMKCIRLDWEELV